MSDLSPSSPQQNPLQSDAVSPNSPPPNEEAPNLPDLETAPPAADPAEENSLGEEEDDDEEGEGEEVDEEAPAVPSTMDLRIEPPITDGAADVTLLSPGSRRGGSKRRKGKGKGKGKSNPKKLQAINEKLQNLRSNLKPVPFIPSKIPNFANQEKVLKQLGLWDFVQIKFDRKIRVDLIAQLIANYNPKLRNSYVNEFRVKVNRADLARALNLRMKEKGGSVGAAAEVDLDWEVMPDESIGFVVGFVSDWILLHEDTWLMPTEVMNWMKLIREGHPEKVDWAGMLWFMVEKELKQGGKLKDCYYASHLQHLMKSQCAEVFLMDPVNGEVDSDGEVEVVEDLDNEEDVKESDVVENAVDGRGVDAVVEGPSTKLTLGQEEEEEKEVEMADAEICKDSDEEVGEEEQEQEQEHEHEHEQEHWLLNGKTNPGEHFLQRCSVENVEFGGFDDRKDEDEEEEMDGEEEGEEDEELAGNDFHVFPNDSLEGDGFTGNFLQGLEANQMGFPSQEQLPNASSVDVRADVQHIGSPPSFFNNTGKRVIEHDYHHDTSKRLRINEAWDNKPVEFGMCMEQIQQWAQRARMMYEEKEQAAEQSGMHQQILLSELQKRDAVIDHLHKVRLEESQKKDYEINRLERELYLIGSVLDGYRKALKDVKKSFAEYRERTPLPEEPTYKDAGPGGLMLTSAEIERRRKKREEEFRMNCLFVEQKMREVEAEFIGRFEGFVENVNLFDKRLIGLKADAKELIAAASSKKRIPETEIKVGEVAETLPVQEPDEPAAVAEEVSELPPSAEPDEEMAEAADNQAIAQSDEKGVEAAEPLPVE